MRNPVLFAALAVTWALGACGAEPGSPEAAVEAFLDACQQGDQAALLATLQESDRQTLERLQARGGEHSFGPGVGFAYEIDRVRTRGVTATAEVRLSKDGATETQSLALIREDDQWRVDLIPNEMAPLFDGLTGMSESLAEGMGRSMKDTLRNVAEDMQGNLDEAMRGLEGNR